jgi:hypothetical protein
LNRPNTTPAQCLTAGTGRAGAMAKFILVAG